MEAGLQSAPVRTRNVALNVLEAWTQAMEKPLPEALPDMQALLSELREIEPDPDARHRMEELLSGELPSHQQ